MLSEHCPVNIPAPCQQAAGHEAAIENAPTLPGHAMGTQRLRNGCCQGYAQLRRCDHVPSALSLFLCFTREARWTANSCDHTVTHGAEKNPHAQGHMKLRNIGSPVSCTGPQIAVLAGALTFPGQQWHRMKPQVQLRAPLGGYSTIQSEA